MYNDIFKYYSLTMYQNDIQNKNIMLDSYNEYIKNEKDNIKCIIYDIKSHEEYNGIILKEIEYKTNLEFTYNLKDNIIIIDSLPSIEYNFDTFKVFMEDILEILKKIVSNYRSFDDIKILFKSKEVFAYSSTIKNYLSNEDTKLIDDIVKRTNLVIYSLNKKVLNDKKRQDLLDLKKKKIFIWNK